MLGPIVGGGGLGRYVEELVRELGKLDHKHRTVLFLKRENFDFDSLALSKGDQTQSGSVEKRLADIHWYTIKEQIVMPWLIDRARLDLVHFPHWNVPLLVRTPFVVTIHDLILLEEPLSAKATTRHPAIFALKRAAQRLILKNALWRARAIIAVSNHTKSSILKFFPWVPEKKIHVIYEGLTPLVHAPKRVPEAHSSPPLSLLYVGNAYPHKNLEMLLAAFQRLRTHHPNLSLTLAGRGDVFYERLKQKTLAMGLAPHVRFVLNPTDASLSELYVAADLYVFPSRHEGFGLPPLEAMSAGVPVVSSNAGAMPEILGDAAAYFDPRNVHDMTRTIQLTLTDAHLRERLIQKGFEQIQRYSWSKMARKILDIYQRHAS